MNNFKTFNQYSLFDISIIDIEETSIMLFGNIE